MQPHWLAEPLPPQVWGLLQRGQVAVRVVPQLSSPVIVPQPTPNRAQSCASDSGVQTQTLLAEQVRSGATVQRPQPAVRLTPQLSSSVTWPHVLPRRAQNSAFDSAVQPGT